MIRVMHIMSKKGYHQNTIGEDENEENDLYITGCCFAAFSGGLFLWKCEQW
jgi:hypothetical protein